jgi:Mg-chelatase subunit ChlD
MLKRAGWIVAALIGMSWPGVAWAQAPGAHRLSAGPAYTSKDGQDGPRFPRIEVAVRLTDGNGAQEAVKPEDLRLFSGGTELGRGVSVRSFAETGYGVKSILALDLSGSMNGEPLNAVRATIARFVGQARSQDRVEVVSFADDTRVEVPFGASKETLTGSLKKVRSRGTLTRLYDGLLDAMDQFDATPPVRRQLTVISDGHDEGSRHSIDDVIRRALAEKVAIDSIGLTRAHPEYLQSLLRISQASGGSYAQARSSQELDGLIDRGIQAMRAMPVAAFKTSKLAADGKAHSLELQWQPEHLTAAVEIQTPRIANLWRVWGWVLAGCFAAGVILLIVSRRQARRGMETTAQPPSGPGAPPEEISAWPGARSGLMESGEEKIADPPPARAYVPTAFEGEPVAPRRERARTRMAVFFNPAQSGQGAVLEAIAGPLAGESLPVTGTVTIGAAEGNQLTIAGDPTLSGFHARVLLADQVLTVEDSNSTNGTFVNGARLPAGRKLLKPGDEIRMGRSIFKVRNG